MSAIVPTNSLLIGHESHLLCCRWMMKHLYIDSREKLCVRGEKLIQSSWVSIIFCLPLPVHHLSILPHGDQLLSSEKFLNIVVSPENVSVFTRIPWEQAMNGNLYNEKCKAWGNSVMNSTNNAFMATDKYPYKKSQNGTCWRWSKTNLQGKEETKHFLFLTH